METTSLVVRVDERWGERGKLITLNNLFDLFAICFIFLSFFKFCLVQVLSYCFLPLFFSFATVEGRREGRLKQREQEKWEGKKQRMKKGEGKYKTF